MLNSPDSGSSRSTPAPVTKPEDSLLVHEGKFLINFLDDSLTLTIPPSLSLRFSLSLSLSRSLPPSLREHLHYFREDLYILRLL